MSTSEKIKYTVEFEPCSRQINITVCFNAPLSAGQIIGLPAWTLGSYCIRDYAKYVTDIKAQGTGLIKINNNQYKLEQSIDRLMLTYQLYANDVSIRGCYCDEDRVFINGSAAFLYIDGYQNVPVEIRFECPKIYNNYKIATGLDLVNIRRWEWGVYGATNYDHLIDCPIAIADINYTSFEIKGVTHDIAYIGPVLGNTNILTQDVAKICESQADIFEDKLPFDYYVFMLQLAENNYGGLEHRNSSALICTRYSLQKDSNPKQYNQLLGLFSHEYFHAWNVKRIKPEEFCNQSYNQPSYTTLLWVFEGFTAYFDDLSLVRSRCIKPSEYFNLLVSQISRYRRGPGAKRQSLSASSFDAWSKFYFRNENSVNQEVSYYNKGALVACLLDLKIRLASQNKQSLITVMQRLWSDFGKPEQGITESDIYGILNQHGVDTEFLNQAIHTTQMLAIDEILEACGLNLVYKPYVMLDQYYPDMETPNSDRGYLGCVFQRSESGVVISSVNQDTPAQKAGLWAGDEIIAINDIKLTAKNIDVNFKSFKQSQIIKIAYFRDHVLKEVNVQLGAPLKEIGIIEIKQDLTSTQKTLLSGWLNQP